MTRPSSSLVVLGVLLAGCATPSLTQDGQLVFTPGSNGAVVLTANGVEIRDRADVPKAVARASPYEPWRPATGFLLPHDGVWRATSSALELRDAGVSAVVRTSDAFVPSWGGDAFFRIEVAADGEKTTRKSVVLVLDDDDADRGNAAVRAVLARLRSWDEVTVVDARGARLVVPTVRGIDGTLVQGAVATRYGRRSSARRDLDGALQRMRDFGGSTVTDVVVASSGAGTDDFSALESLARSGVRVVAASPTRSGVRLTSCAPRSEDDFQTVDEAINRALGPRPFVVVRDLILRVSGAPGPALAPHLREDPIGKEPRRRRAPRVEDTRDVEAVHESVGLAADVPLATIQGRFSAGARSDSAMRVMITRCACVGGRIGVRAAARIDAILAATGRVWPRHESSASRFHKIRWSVEGRVRSVSASRAIGSSHVSSARIARR